MVIDVCEWNNSVIMNVLGQSGDPESPFYDNLLDEFVEGGYFQLLYTREAIDSACTMQINFEPVDREKVRLIQRI